MYEVVKVSMTMLDFHQSDWASMTMLVAELTYALNLAHYSAGRILASSFMLCMCFSIVLETKRSFGFERRVA